MARNEAKGNDVQAGRVLGKSREEIQAGNEAAKAASRARGTAVGGARLMTAHDEWVAGLITPEQRAQAAEAVARLTPAEQTRALVEVYATAAAHGDDTARMVQLGRDVVATVRLRSLPGYREMVGRAGPEPTPA